ncbi:HNH endonuclease [Leisingera sp. NJS204]|uniref:HNH endonuclease n=1 Tax=Leisingera sp. NJS204 TaxID=2508307 RepID=UPI00101326B2|nr:HNH endonuclease [Leisingera sp. NJS204]QAX31041.1 HNH endonuclease [Leisingera sp. NJS204]
MTKSESSELGKCIFCKKTVGPFRSVEHIVPESMGNISGRRVLPKGAVCDPCNNYFATKVEGPVLSHISFQNLRAKYMVPTKRGKTPFVRGFAHNTDIEVGMRLNKKTERLEFFAVKESQTAEYERLKRLDAMFVRQNLLVFPMDVDPPQKEMSRFLAKMAFEALFERFCCTVGEQEAYDIISGEHYDRVREWARYGHNFDEWPFHYRAYFPEETLMEHPDTREWVRFGFGYDLLLTGTPETYFVFSYYGHEFAINLGGPAIKGYEEWLGENNHVSFLVEKKGSFVQTVTENGEERHFLVPLIVFPKT